MSKRNHKASKARASITERTANERMGRSLPCQQQNSQFRKVLKDISKKICSSSKSSLLRPFNTALNLSGCLKEPEIDISVVEIYVLKNSPQSPDKAIRTLGALCCLVLSRLDPRLVQNYDLLVTLTRSKKFDIHSLGLDSELVRLEKRKALKAIAMYAGSKSPEDDFEGNPDSFIFFKKMRGTQSTLKRNGSGSDDGSLIRVATKKENNIFTKGMEIGEVRAISLAQSLLMIENCRAEMLPDPAEFILWTKGVSQKSKTKIITKNPQIKSKIPVKSFGKSYAYQSFKVKKKIFKSKNSPKSPTRPYSIVSKKNQTDRSQEDTMNTSLEINLEQEQVAQKLIATTKNQHVFWSSSTPKNKNSPFSHFQIGGLMRHERPKRTQELLGSQTPKLAVQEEVVVDFNSALASSNGSKDVRKGARISEKTTKISIGNKDKEGGILPKKNS